MGKRTSNRGDPDALRKEAAKRLTVRRGANDDAPQESQQAQDLAVHRIELEIQNEQLREAQTELEAGLDRYTQLFDFAPIGYATLTRDGKMLQVNHVGAALLGRTRRELSHHVFASFLARADRAKFDQLLGKVVAEHDRKTCEVQLLRDAGESPTLRFTASTLAAAEPTVLLAFEDITPQKRAEQSLRRADDELREADRRKDEFLAVLSHELRTPLSAILLHSQLLQRETLDEAAVRRAGERIESAARAQARLVEDLLDVSRIAAGKLSLTFDRVNISAAVRAAVDAVAEQAKRRNIDVVVAIDPSVRPVMGDPIRLQQAVWNLLVNAIKFTPEKGRIDVIVDEVDHRVRIQVRDTGVGIDPSFLPYIFLRFVQADRTTTRAAGGLGLGLSIAHSVVEAHRGELRAASPGKGKGSTFTITLPTVEESMQRVTAGPARPVVPRRQIRGARLLVVEDDPGTRATLTQVLELAGAHVRDVESSAAAMSVFDSFQPDLLLCDIAMPEEDGCSLLRRIRAQAKKRGGDVRAVALTAFADEESRARTRDAGFQEHLVKPVDIEQLLTTVADLLPRDGGSDRAAPAQ